MDLMNLWNFFIEIWRSFIETGLITKAQYINLLNPDQNDADFKIPLSLSMDQKYLSPCFKNLLDWILILSDRNFHIQDHRQETGSEAEPLVKQERDRLEQVKTKN